MSVIEKAVQWAVAIAADNSHGYSQSIRWGSSYDCSSLIISAFKQAGLNLQSTYTGNMKQDFLAHGFALIPVNFVTGDGLQRGDVLLNEVHHTALYLGEGIIVHARSSEGTNDTIDNSGNEIREQMYYNYPWDCCLRYTGAATDSSTPSTSKPTHYCSVKLRELQINDKGDDVAFLQSRLISHGYWCGLDGADGDWGKNTDTACRKFQQDNGLEADGVCGQNTWDKLTGG